MSNTATTGIAEQIRKAPDIKSLASLCELGRTYDKASQRTHNRMKRNAAIRRAELMQEVLAK